MTTPPDPRIAELNAWLIDATIRGQDHVDMLDGYCHKLVEFDVPVTRVHAAHTALHPVYGAIAFQWNADAGSGQEAFARSDEPVPEWRNSPFYYMISQKKDTYRERMWQSNEPSRFPLLKERRLQGATDYLAALVNF